MKRLDRVRVAIGYFVGGCLFVGHGFERRLELDGQWSS